MGKLLITRKQHMRLLSLYAENNKAVLFIPILDEADLPIASIVIAKVTDVAKQLGGAFLSVRSGQKVYLPYQESNKILCVNRSLSAISELKQGDELVVQITEDAVKTKLPTASTVLTLTGQYCVCQMGRHGISCSRKLSPEKQALLKEQIAGANLPGRKQYHFTIRTNSGELTDLSPLFAEMKQFIEIFDSIEQTYPHRTVYSRLYQPEQLLLQAIKDIPLADYEEILTDDAATYHEIQQALLCKPVRFYEDPLLPLEKLYAISSDLDEALSRKVWLPCGGYLIIEQTEAMLVIDVNSGKAQSRSKEKQSYVKKVNLEAAKEIARQLKLRNSSGMILIDFINMEKEEDNQELLSAFDHLLKKDKIHTRLVDLTALGIVEVTRKKERKPLADFFQEKQG